MKYSKDEGNPLIEQIEEYLRRVETDLLIEFILEYQHAKEKEKEDWIQQTEV